MTADQAASQADPTSASSINFSVVFSAPVSDFTATDVTLGGTAGANAVAITNRVGDHMHYNVAVSGMSHAGTVTVSLAAGVAHDLAGNASLASTSTDNSVTYVLAPTATVSLSNHAPLTNDTLTATATTSDPNGYSVSLTYVWTVNGTVKQTDTTAALTDTFNLSVAGNGNKGDVIVVSVTPNNGYLNGTTVTDSATVADTAPSATVSLNSHTPRTNDVLTATATSSDADGDSVSLTYVWRVDGTVKQTDTTTILTDTFNLGVLGNVDPGNVVTVEVTPYDGTLYGTTVTDTATVVSNIRTWDGGGGADHNWLTAANWAGDVAAGRRRPVGVYRSHDDVVQQQLRRRHYF